MPAFSEAQNKAMHIFDGQAIIIACPGAGKTTVIVNRAAEMVKSGIDPYSMLNITFTKAAAEEMEKRFHKLSDAPVSFSTIHAFCYRILLSRYGYSQDDIFKQSDAYMFIADALRLTGVMPNQIEDQTKEIMNGISYVKNREIEADKFKTDKVKQNVFVAVYTAYENYKKEIGKLDFDDMIILFKEKLHSDNDLLQSLRDRYKYITIDEFQDVNRTQADIFYTICGDNGNIYIVGDDDQSIYGFRAAESSIMLDFPNRFKNAQTVFLSTNYRSTKEIIEPAAKLIRNNKNRFYKDFRISSEETGSVNTKVYKGSVEQASEIVKAMKEAEKNGTPYKEMAVLFRTNNLATTMAMKLSKENIPFYAAEHVDNIYESPIFNDIKAYYRLANGMEKKGDFQRILNKPSRYAKAEVFKDCTYKNKDGVLLMADKCKSYVKNNIIDMLYDIKSLEGRSPKQFVSYLGGIMHYKKYITDHAKYLGKEPEDDMAIFKHLEEEAGEFETMEEWLKYADQYRKIMQEASRKKNKEGVCLSTFHGSKGLEWEKVFIINANKGTCPYSKAETEAELEEERRMFYVAATRAKRSLDISYILGEDNDLKPSQYLYEMGLIEKKPQPKATVKKRVRFSDISK